MRTRKGLGPAPRPQPDNSRPSSPAVPPEPRRLTPRLPRSRGAAAAGPHAAMPGDAAGGHGAPERRRHCVQIRLPGRARPLLPGGRARSTVATRKHGLTCKHGRPQSRHGPLPLQGPYPPPGHTPRQPEPWGAQNRPPSPQHPNQCSGKLTSFLIGVPVKDSSNRGLLSFVF